MAICNFHVVLIKACNMPVSRMLKTANYCSVDANLLTKLTLQRRTPMCQTFH
jgi:hypothetical protein